MFNKITTSDQRGLFLDISYDTIFKHKISTIKKSNISLTIQKYHNKYTTKKNGEQSYVFLKNCQRKKLTTTEKRKLNTIDNTITSIILKEEQVINDNKYTSM